MAKSDDTFSQFCCCSTKGLIIAGCLLFFPFFLVGVVSNAAAALVYRVQMVPGFTYESPKPEILACHWLATISGMLMGISFWVAVRHPIIGFALLLTSAMFLFGSYFAYVLVFFLSEYYTAEVQMKNLDEALEILEDAKKAKPWYALYGEGYLVFYIVVNGTRKRLTQKCRTSSVYFEVESSGDETDEVSLSERDFHKVLGLKIKPSVEVMLTPEANEMVGDVLHRAKGCYTDSLDTITMATEGGVFGLPEEVLVTPDGKPLSCVSTRHAIASGIFMSGASYAYRLASMASISAKIVKKNVSLKPYEALDTLCSRLGRCYAV